MAAIQEDTRWDFTGYRTINYYSLTYILDGRCHYTEPTGRDLVFVAGDLFFCFPGLPHRFDPMPGEQFSEFWISFTGPAFDLWRELAILDPARFSLHLEPTEHWTSRFETLFANFRNDSYGQMMLVSKLQALLLEAMSIQPRPIVETGDAGWIVEAKAMIETAGTEDELDLSAIAGKLNMSYSNFRRKFVELAGIPPGRYHTVRLMEQACEWMLTSHGTIKDVANGCGFQSESHFSKRFKQVMGMTPREFRAKLHQNDPRSQRPRRFDS